MILKIFPTLWNLSVRSLIFIFILFPFFISADELVDELINKYSPFYVKYKGVQSERVVSAVSKDPENGKVLKKFKVTISRNDFFYKTPDLKALKYSENGNPGDLDDYDTREVEPFYPLFDKKSEDNYEFVKTGEKKVGGADCVEYQVKAKKKSARHFIGKIYIDKKSKTLVKLKGTLAKRHWAIKKYDFVFNYSDLKGFPVITSGIVTARVKVFLIISDNITDYEIKVRSSRFF